MDLEIFELETTNKYRASRFGTKRASKPGPPTATKHISNITVKNHERFLIRYHLNI